MSTMYSNTLNASHTLKCVLLFWATEYAEFDVSPILFFDHVCLVTKMTGYWPILKESQYSKGLPISFC